MEETQPFPSKRKPVAKVATWLVGPAGRRRARAVDAAAGRRAGERRGAAPVRDAAAAAAGRADRRLPPAAQPQQEQIQRYSTM